MWYLVDVGSFSTRFRSVNTCNMRSAALLLLTFPLYPNATCTVYSVTFVFGNVLEFRRTIIIVLRIVSKISVTFGNNLLFNNLRGHFVIYNELILKLSGRLQLLSSIECHWYSYRSLKMIKSHLINNGRYKDVLKDFTGSWGDLNVIQKVWWSGLRDKTAENRLLRWYKIFSA